jgi:hypothetical protein
MVYSEQLELRPLEFTFSSKVLEFHHHIEQLKNNPDQNALLIGLHDTTYFIRNLFDQPDIHEAFHPRLLHQSYTACKKSMNPREINKFEHHYNGAFHSRIVRDFLVENGIDFESYAELALLMKDSFVYLGLRTEEAYKTVEQHRIKLTSILSQLNQNGFGKTIVMKQPDFLLQPDSPKFTFNGVEAVILWNLLKNAIRYSSEPDINLLVETNQIEVINHSQHPLPDKLFNLGVKGPNGHTGVGLYLSQLYALKSGVDLSAIFHALHPCSGYEVSLLLERKPLQIE